MVYVDNIYNAITFAEFFKLQKGVLLAHIVSSLITDITGDNAHLSFYIL